MCVEALSELELRKSSILELIHLHVKMYGLLLLVENSGWLISNNIVSQGNGKSILKCYYETIKLMHNSSFNVVEAFGFPEHFLTAPIA